ncbi:MAG: AGE family epimerase/isomerase [Bacteroidales bacterium]|nr:AGE family epimerase/isomerase [Bacteroidales bacterium]
MKRFSPVILSLALLLAPTLLLSQSRSQIETLSKSIENNLTENILPFWMDYTVDPDGGFYGTVMNDGTPRPTDKGAIMNARIIWTFSRAYRIYGNPAYKEMADRAAEYFKEHFIDKKYGGVYWSVTSEGNMSDGTKQTYANAFGVYGLSEHFRATGDISSLEAAKDIFHVLQKYSHDPVKKGYIEVFDRDWSRSGAKGVDGRTETSKTMNTHIHVMEGFTNLWFVWPDPEVKAAILELLDILQTHLYNADTKHLILYCNDDWKMVATEDSYGHDIETSWLMCESAEAVGDEALIAKIRKQAIEMVDVALAEGIRPDGGMKYEGERLQWWPECETVIGCINAWQITGDRKYFDAAAKCWDFTEKYFVDKEVGGWYKDIMADGTPVARSAKASMWNCPYHNSRMGYEVVARLAHPAVHTEVMAWSNMTGVRSEGELIDFESTLRVGVPGGDIESTGREKQSRIRYERDGFTQTTVTPMHGGVTFTQSVTDVDLSTVNLKWNVVANEAADGGAYFCMNFAPKYYSEAKINASGKKVTITAPERSIELTFNKSVKTFVREENGDKVLYVTFLPKIKKGAKADYSAVMKVSGVQHHEVAHIDLDASNPGRLFTGFGGNFRIQNVQKDPEVIDYCLENLRVAFGRVEFPWGQWDQLQHPELYAGQPQGRGISGANPADHIRRSAEMARRLKEIGMPVIVSAWFPPMWAGNQTTRSDGTSRAYSLKPEEQDRIFESIASYLIYLKKEYGCEPDYFSFNESDLGINVVHTPEEHRDFIKNFGKYMASQGLKTLMLLGDNSDATTFDFIVPTLNDPEALRYVGAISFHSWRGCDDETLKKWAAASRQINVPLIVGEGSTDAAAHQYAGIFNESTFALYEINLYTRICAISQPLSILQWQLTSDYSLLWGDGIYNSAGPLRPTQRFFNIKQLAATPADSFAIPTTVDKDNVNVASFINIARGESAVHIVNNAASCPAVITGLPASSTYAVVQITNSGSNSDSMCLPVVNGKVEVNMPAESFVSVFVK